MSQTSVLQTLGEASGGPAAACYPARPACGVQHSRVQQSAEGRGKLAGLAVSRLPVTRGLRAPGLQ